MTTTHFVYFTTWFTAEPIIRIHPGFMDLVMMMVSIFCSSAKQKLFSSPSKANLGSYQETRQRAYAFPQKGKNFFYCHCILFFGSNVIPLLPSKKKYYIYIRRYVPLLDPVNGLLTAATFVNNNKQIQHRDSPLCGLTPNGL